MIKINLDEGNQYYYRNITWKGNSIYESKILEEVLGIKKGDIYNQEELQTRLQFSQDGRDISTLYMDYGYLFFSVDLGRIVLPSVEATAQTSRRKVAKCRLQLSINLSLFTCAVS